MIPSCALCPRLCRVKRDSTVAGFCHMGENAVVVRAARHDWEEPPVSGSRGSGAVFFVGCGLGCRTCQNADISRGRGGKAVSDEELCDIFMRLESEGVHNLNLVTGTQFIPAILRALNMRTPGIPVVWNSGGYERAEVIRALRGHVSVYLPDLKFMSPRLSGMICGAPDYFDFASKAILEMASQTGAPVYDDEGIMLRGTLVRHLVMPGCTGDSIRVLRWIRDNLPIGTPVSLMRQYMPMPGAPRGLDRPVSNSEYARVLSYAREIGLPGFMQGADASDTRFLPAFDGTGV